MKRDDLLGLLAEALKEEPGVNGELVRALVQSQKDALEAMQKSHELALKAAEIQNQRLHNFMERRADRDLALRDRPAAAMDRGMHRSEVAEARGHAPETSPTKEGFGASAPLDEHYEQPVAPLRTVREYYESVGATYDETVGDNVGYAGAQGPSPR